MITLTEHSQKIVEKLKEKYKQNELNKSKELETKKLEWLKSLNTRKR